MSIISVTPVSKGVVRPFLVTVTTIAFIVEGASRFHFVHHFENWFAIVVATPVALVTLTRVWRWRSHKVHVTNSRVVIEGGVMRHQRTSIEMRDIFAIRVDQRVSERLTRRGYVYVETVAGPVSLGLVRHPSALSRMIDAERIGTESDSLPLDTVFTFEDPVPHRLDVYPEERLWRRPL